MIPGTVRILGYDKNVLRQKVMGIKAIRALTYWGLKEAKDCIEQMERGDPQELIIRVGVTENEFKECIEQLKTAGVIVDVALANDMAISMCEDALQTAIEYKQYDLAQDLLQLVRKYRS